MIPYGRQHVDKNDIQNVLNVLNSSYLTQGKITPKFEKKILKYTNSKYSLTCNSGTSALHIACLSLNLMPGDRVWTSPNSFLASANCIEYCGGVVDFVDINFETGNLSLTHLEEKLIKANKNNTLPKIIIPVHFAGNPTDQVQIWKLSKKYGFKIIEDASHSLGSLNKKERIGSCKYSNITVFSFHPVKTITTAEGGAITTNSKILYEKMSKYRTHGVTQGNYKYKDFYCSYYQDALGYNFRLSDIHSAIGISQLDKINYILKERKNISQYYLNAFKDSNIEPILMENNKKSSNHLFVIRPKNKIKKFNSFNSIKYLRNKGLGVNCHYFPIHLQPYYRKKGFKLGMFKSAEKHAKYSISIPIFVGLTKAKQNKVIDILNNYYI